MDADEQNAGKKHDPHTKARGTAAMTPETRQEVARKGGLAVSKNKQHMADIGRKGGMTVSKNREHMAQIGRKGGEASRKTRGGPTPVEEPTKPGLTTATTRTGEEEAV